MNHKVTDTVMTIAGGIHKAIYKVSKGRFGNKLKGAPVLFLTVTGRKSGKQHTVPLLYLADGDRKVIVASKGGDDRDPVWYLNLQANPKCTIDVAGKTETVTATTISAEEKAELWPKLVELYKTYENYQRKTDRDIPVIALTAG